MWKTWRKCYQIVVALRCHDVHNCCIFSLFLGVLLVKRIEIRLVGREAKELHEVANQIGSDVNTLARRAIRLWMEVEAPVELAAVQFKEKLRRERRSKVA